MYTLSDRFNAGFLEGLKFLQSIVLKKNNIYWSIGRLKKIYLNSTVQCSPQWGSNSRPLVYKTSALTTELWRLRPNADYTIYINKITYNHIADTSVFRFLHCKQILFVKIITQYIWRTFTCMPTVHVHRFSRSLHSNRTFGRLICR